MDWLKDKKNQPIVIGGAVALLVIAIVVIVLSMRSGTSTTAPTMPGMPGAGMPGMPGAGGTASGPPMPGMPGMGSGGGMPGMPGMGSGGGMPGMGGMSGGAGMPGMPGMSGATAAAPMADSGAIPAVAVMQPVEKYRSDPFAPLGVKIGKRLASSRTPALKPTISDFPIKRLFTYSTDNGGEAQLAPEPMQPARRMAGILLNSRIFAILETNGKFEIVQPGDTLADRLAIVERVERDRVILKTTSKRPRFITIRMAAGNRNTGATGMPGNTRGSGTAPGTGIVPGGAMRPGGGMAPGGAMGPMMGPGGGMGPGGIMPGGGGGGGGMMMPPGAPGFAM